jgi:hypothetical protein
MDEKLSRMYPGGTMETGAVKAVGVWFRASILAVIFICCAMTPNIQAHGDLPGGKIETGETLLGGMERECIEELGSLSHVSTPGSIGKIHKSADLNLNITLGYVWLLTNLLHDSTTNTLGYAWIDKGTWPRPMHPGLWNTVNIEAVQSKDLLVEQDLAGL